jgi:hypothetical protein
LAQIRVNGVEIDGGRITIDVALPRFSGQICYAANSTRLMKRSSCSTGLTSPFAECRR